MTASGTGTPPRATAGPEVAAVDLYWLPLGAGGHLVRLNGRVWDSNSVIAWLIARSGVDAESIHPPTEGRAPGWRAGLVVARRQERRCRPESP